ncbi:hypothetical protein LTR17_015975 [Elasticomyces elasticus]|nr:hypothetical protein LTR17_015975 [Elasticomyces elasticus]
MSEPNLLSDLPPELQLRICDHLDYGDILRLSRVDQQFHELVEMQTWPAAKKAVFVQQAQRYRQHNILSLDIGPPTYGQIEWDNNGFACYSCYRVRPREKFAVRQTTKHNAKESPNDRDSATGCGRFCLDCGIEKGVYRGGTRLSITIGEALTAAPERTYLSDRETQVLCWSCESFIFTEVFRQKGARAWCHDCKVWNKTAADRHYDAMRRRSAAQIAATFAKETCVKRAGVLLMVRGTGGAAGLVRRRRGNLWRK